MQEKEESSSIHHRSRTVQVLSVAIASAYLNSIFFGFSYGASNHEFELPLVNWLRNSNLYPQDPIREAFARFPTLFWAVVAYFSHWFDTEKVLFIFFLITKILFFLAVARIVAARAKDNRLVAYIVLAIALSPFLNDQTPLGASTVLDSVQTQTTFAVALLVWVGCFLLEQRWIPAALLGALVIYVDALYFVFMLFAIATFAAFDWRERRSEILAAGLLGIAISIPWLFMFRGLIHNEFPSGYVEALLAFYPFHLNLRSHDSYEIAIGAGIVVAAALIVIVARRARISRDVRLEILTASFLVPVCLGAIFGKFYLTPVLARLQLLRADSFLLLYSILLVQIYGANLLGTVAQSAGAACLLGVTAILLPIADSVGLVWLLILATALWVDPHHRFDRVVRSVSGVPVIRAVLLGLLFAGIIATLLMHVEWSFTVAVCLTILMGCCCAVSKQNEESVKWLGGLASVACSVVFLSLVISHDPALHHIWNPVVSPTRLESDWRAVQEWAGTNSPPDAIFLVPTYPGGFRAFSERSSWGEWKDGQAMYLYPPFEAEYRKRMMAVGYLWGNWMGTEAITQKYKQLSWNQLLETARENHLSYIIQFREVIYPANPLFANQSYSVYKVAY